jgi:hypothetical protein
MNISFKRDKFAEQSKRVPSLLYSVSICRKKDNQTTADKKELHNILPQLKTDKQRASY